MRCGNLFVLLRCPGSVGGFPCVQTEEERDHGGGAGSSTEGSSHVVVESGVSPGGVSSGGHTEEGDTEPVEGAKDAGEATAPYDSAASGPVPATVGLEGGDWPVGWKDGATATQRARATACLEISLQLGFAAQKLEMVKEAYEDAVSKLEGAKVGAMEAASAARLGRRMYDFLQQNRRALLAALKKIDMKRKLLEVDKMMKLSRALKALGDRIEGCYVKAQAERPAGEVEREKSRVFGDMVEDKGRVLEEEASLLGKLLGREAVGDRMRRIEDDLQQGAKRVEAKVREFRSAIERAAARTKEEIETVGAEAAGDLKQQAASLRRAAGDAMLKSHQALIEIIKALQRSLFEEKARKLVDKATEEVESADESPKEVERADSADGRAEDRVVAGSVTGAADKR